MSIKYYHERCRDNDYPDTIVPASVLAEAYRNEKRLENGLAAMRQMMEELQKESENRHLNDLEYGRIQALSEALDAFDS